MTAAAPLPRRNKSEALALGWISVLVDAHNLPEPERAFLIQHDADHLRMCPGIDPAVLMVRLADRAHVARWAAVLGVKPETRHVIYEYDDGQWCANWTEIAAVRGWFPGVKLRVFHTEDRWIDRCADVRKAALS